MTTERIAYLLTGQSISGRIVVIAGLLPGGCPKGLDRERGKVRQPQLMQFVHSGILDGSAPDAFPIGSDNDDRSFYPEGLQTSVVQRPAAFKCQEVSGSR